jgi:hypothetical protein
MGSVVVGSALAEESFTYYGTTVGGPLFNRPNGGTAGAPPFALSGVVTPYSRQSFQTNQTVACFVSSVQNSKQGSSPPVVFDGWIHVYQGSFDPTNPLSQIQRGDDDGPLLGVGTSETTTFTATANTPYIVVTSGDDATSDIGDFQNTVSCQPTGTTPLVITHGSCTSDGATRACLNNGRFQVSATFQPPGGPQGAARVVQFGSGDTALFSFFDPQNWELLVKVLNFCNVNNSYSVFAAGATDVGVVLTVTDTTGGGGTVTITNPQGTPFEKRAIAMSNSCP